jgi:hypothetical protein
LIPNLAETKSATTNALRVGFRHFDCAERYRNEREVGESLTAEFATGAIAREEVFITTKLWNTNHRPERVEPAFNASCARLCTERQPQQRFMLLRLVCDTAALLNWDIANLEVAKRLRGFAFETRAVVRFEPVERAAFLRVQSELLAFLGEVGALFGIFHHAGGLHLIRPGFDFRSRFRCAIGLQPDANVFIIFRGLDGGLELCAVDALKLKSMLSSGQS